MKSELRVAQLSIPRYRCTLYCRNIARPHRQRSKGRTKDRFDYEIREMLETRALRAMFIKDARMWIWKAQSRPAAMAKSPKWLSTLSRVEFSFTAHGITVSKGLLEAVLSKPLSTRERLLDLRRRPRVVLSVSHLPAWWTPFDLDSPRRRIGGLFVLVWEARRGCCSDLPVLHRDV